MAIALIIWLFVAVNVWALVRGADSRIGAVKEQKDAIQWPAGK
jgi:hypothetical protein